MRSARSRGGPQVSMVESPGLAIRPPAPGVRARAHSSIPPAKLGRRNSSAPRPAALLAAAGLGALEFLRPSFAGGMLEWARALTPGAGSRIASQVLSTIETWSPQRLRALSIAAFLYAVLFVIEGT